MSEQHIKYLLHLADNSLILGQRLGEWCGHGPILEQDIALTNISLDLIGQSRLMYQHVAQLQGEGKTEDDLAYLRLEHHYYNLLLCEYPNGDFAQTVLRQFFFDAFNYYNLEALLESNDEQLAAIAEKSIKEVRYHLRYSSEWVIRLGDGTEESHSRMVNAVESLWMFTGELFKPVPYETECVSLGIAADTIQFAPLWNEKVEEVFSQAQLDMPDSPRNQNGGKIGRHTEHMGYILSELQYMQRAYPNMQW